MSEFAVAEVHVSARRRERMDDTAEGQKALVNLSTLFGSLACGASVAHALGTSQIHQVEGRDQHGPIGVTSSAGTLLAFNHQPDPV